MSSHSAYLPSLRGVQRGAADETQAAILDQAQAQVGFIPNMYANMVNVPAVLSTYLHGYGRFRQESGFTSTEQEVIFLAISRINECRYCTAAHSMIAEKKSGVPAEVLAALRSGGTIADAKLAALHDLTASLVKTQGQPDAVTVDRFLSYGYSEQQVLHIILAIAVKTLSNYSNHAFGTELDDRFKPYAL